jgi:hypothetical protein
VIWESRAGEKSAKVVLVAVAILAMVIVPPALAKAKRAKSAAQQGYQSSERPGYYHGYPLSEWYRDAISHY